MPNYFTVTHNPIARAGIIRKLMAKGYSLFETYSVSDYFTRWPAEQWPLVIVRSDGQFQNKPTIDLAQLHSYNEIISDNELYGTRFSPVTLAGVPHANEIRACCGQCSTAPVFPEAAKYSVEYMKADGSIGQYTISNPIEVSNDSITAYAFGRGVRTFKKAKVCRFSKVS